MAIFTVTNTGDNGGVNPGANAGTGTLRQAIIDANAAAGADTINFNIPGAGVQTINLNAVLPSITSQINIDGFSQPGATANTLTSGSNANLLIELNGAGAGNSAGIVLISGSSNSTIKGLVIDRFNRQGILINFAASATNVRIQGNYIGTDPTGTIAKPNAFNGVQIGDGNSNNFIGSDGNGVNDLAERNLISGNTQYGIILEGTGTTGNVVAGNEIGTDASGTAAIPNGLDGILIYRAAQSNLIGGSNSSDRNIISSNNRFGVYVLGAGTSNNQIQGNYIGLNANGSGNLGNIGAGIRLEQATNNTVRGNAISNNDRQGNTVTATNANILIFNFGTNNNTIAGNLIGTNASGTALPTDGGVRGIQINNGPQGNIIGGTTAADRNIVSDQRHVGIEFVGNISNNKAIGNYIGTDITGEVSIGNGFSGVGYFLVTNPNPFGGGAVGEGNLISGNKAEGVYFIGSSNQSVQGNRIGISASGNPLGNQTNGIRLFSNANNNNTIGSNNDGINDAAEANTIAYNVQDGIAIESGTGDRISRNSIFNNGQLGIDLGNNGVTPNDLLDPDTGANNLQNFPVLALGTNAVGSLNSTANTTFRLEFFSNSTPDPSNNGEGQTYLGSQNVTTDASGNGSFSFNFGTVVNVAATATDPSGNTSEFSNVAAGITVTPTSGLVTTESGGTANFTVKLNSQPTANVTLGLSSSNTAEGVISTPSLTFTPANFNTPQTVTITGIDDLVVDGNIAYSIITAAATSTDLNYNGLDPSDVSVTNNDNDTTPIGDPVTTIPSGNGKLILGNNLDNTIIGSSSNDTIYGYAGVDRIFGQDGNDYIDGGIGNDSLSGGAGNDTLIGGAGNDSIRGDVGADLLIGGADSDIFVYSSPSEGGDTITAFASGLDSIRVSQGGFGGGLLPGVLLPSQFGLGAAATTSAQRLIYDTATGILRFDVDGSGAGASSILATLTGSPALLSSNISVF